MTHTEKINPGSGFIDMARESKGYDMPMSSDGKDDKKTRYYYPSLYLSDVPIPDVKVGDVVEATVKFRVESKTERATDDGNEGSMDLEVIGVKWPQGTSVEEPVKESDDEAIDRGLDEAMSDDDED